MQGTRVKASYQLKVNRALIKDDVRADVNVYRAKLFPLQLSQIQSPHPSFIWPPLAEYFPYSSLTEDPDHSANSDKMDEFKVRTSHLEIINKPFFIHIEF